MLLKKIIAFLSLTMLFVSSVMCFSAEAAAKRIALMLNGAVGSGDASFNDVCIHGLKLARDHYRKSIITKVYNADRNETLFAQLLEEAADNSELIIIPTAEYLNFIPEIQKKHPTVKIVTFEPSPAEGVEEILFKDEEGGFLAGALAAILTKREGFSRANPRGEIGIILGPSNMSTKRFNTGFAAGAWYVDKSVKPIQESIDDFSDADKGRMAADKLKKRGADIIFPVAGASGLGVLQNAAKRNYWVIGVDSEQEVLFPDVVLASIVKRSDYVIATVIDKYMKNSLSGDKVPVGISDGAISLSLWTREAKRNIPLDVRQRMDDIEDKLANGLIIIKTDN